jgi:hypothetical protein
MSESFEAIAWVRPVGSKRELEQKWLTVETDDRTEAAAAFRALGFEFRGMTILPQEEATELARRF